MEMKKTLLTALTGLAFAAGSAQAETIIYQDDFSGLSSADLAGTTPDTGASNWTANSNWKADGSIAAGGGGAGDLSNAYLAFTPEDGKIYTLSIDMTVPTGDWFAFGFMSSNTVNDDFFNNSTGDGAPWMLVRSDAALQDDSAFETGTDGVGAFSRSSTTVSIELDTTGTDWVATWFDGATQVATHTYTGLDLSDDINYIGIGRFTTAAGSVDNLLLTVVPEPGSLALMGLGGLCVLRRRRG